MDTEKKAVKKTVAKKTATKPAVKKTAAKKPVAEKAVAESAVKKAVIEKNTTKPKTAKQKTVNITLIKSFHGRLPSHRATVTGLGLKRINHKVSLIDTPEVRGMINKISYLLKVED